MNFTKQSLYIKQPVVKNSEIKKMYKRPEEGKPQKPFMNRLYSLPNDIINKIFEYDDTLKKYFEKNILCKTGISYGREEKERNGYKFYQMILNNRVINKEYRKKYCEFISCGITTSWFNTNDQTITEYPFPYDLVNINSRYVSAVKVKKNIYEYKKEKFYFIRCEMEIIEFVKELYKFLGEPEDDDFNVIFYNEWEDEYEVVNYSDWREEYEYFYGETTSNIVFYEYLKKSDYGDFKKIMLKGDAISEFCNLILFADKNEQGKDVVYIMVDMDLEAIEDNVQDNTGFVSRELIEKKIRRIYDMRVYDVIQVNKIYLSTHIFDNENKFSTD